MPDLYAAAVPPARLALDRADHLLDRAAASGAGTALLAARLHPGMMDAAGQLRTVAGFSLRATFPLAGRTPPEASFRDDLRGLRARLAFARAELASLAPGDLAADMPIRHIAGQATLTQTPADYLHLFALPNLWFDLSMAYAIFRHAGLPIGKADFDGLHAYPPAG